MKEWVWVSSGMEFACGRGPAAITHSNPSTKPAQSPINSFQLLFIHLLILLLGWIGFAAEEDDWKDIKTVLYFELVKTNAMESTKTCINLS